MSPEQARGRPLDKRTDVFSLGCVLYECLTGRQAFRGETVSDTLAAILKSEPDWDALSAETPERVRLLLRRCLEKDPARRLHDIADARIEIEDALAQPQAASAPTARGSGSRPRSVLWAAAGLLAGALAAFLAERALRPARPHDTPRAPVRSVLTLPPGVTLRTGPFQPSMVFSPDGRRLVFSVRDGKARLHARALDRQEIEPIPGRSVAAALSSRRTGSGWPSSHRGS